MDLRSSCCALFALFALVTASAAPSRAQERPAVGQPAPEITATAWVGWTGDAPSLASLKGKVVLLEFWGTWCGPCVRAMPGIQKLHDRYRERGLTVLAITYEDQATVEPFLAKNAFTMPVGCDTEKKTVGAYGIRSWPTTIVLDKEGKVAHVGSPYDAEAAVEKALGLEAGPAALLTQYLDSLKAPAKPAQREALQRLREKAPPDFDLQAWAKGQLAPESVPADGATPTPAPTKPAAAAAKPGAKPADPADLLRKCAAAWAKNPAQRTQLLQQLADAGPASFDLGTFALDAFAKAFPFDANELKTMLADKKYGDVVEAIVQRAPPAPVLAAAAKHTDLAAFCRTKAGEARLMAKKGLMAQHWLFANAPIRDEKLNQQFFSELSVSGMAMSPDKKSITGITLGGEMLMRERADAFVRGRLAQAFVMDDLASGKPPRVKEAAKAAESERAKVLADLEGRYGKPEPVAAK